MEGEPKTTAELAVETIKAIKQEVNVLGANDFEIPRLDELIRQIEAGETTPEKAIEEATSIRDSKQDYH